MKKTDVPSAAAHFSGMPPLESVEALLSGFDSHSHDEAKTKQTFVMYDNSRAHFHGGPVRRLFVELLDEEKEWLARERGHKLEYVGLLRKCTCGTVDASARGQTHYAQILKEHEVVQGLGNGSVCVHETRYSTARSRR